MPPRWLPLLALTTAGMAPVGGAIAQALPEIPPAAEPLPPPADLGTALAMPPPTSPCDCLIPAMPDRPRWVPDYFQALVGDSNKVSIGPKIPTFDYIPITARFGWYLTDPLAPGAVSMLWGNTSGIVTKGFGSYFTGPSVAFRYERRPDRDWVPYFQIGSGLAFNDAYKDKGQRAIGSVNEFCDQFEAGVRYRITGSMSLDTEVAYQHISNARLAGRNLGVNNVAFLTGFTYTFGCR
jgi:hypothetical protein